MENDNSNDTIEEVISSTNENNCDNNKSPVEKESCQFLKCIPKEKNLTCDNNEDNDENYYNIITETNLNGSINDLNDDCSDNACACDHFEQCYDNQIFAKLNEDGEWIISWNICEHHEEDFIALCYHGEFYFLH